MYKGQKEKKRKVNTFASGITSHSIRISTLKVTNERILPENRKIPFTFLILRTNRDHFSLPVSRSTSQQVVLRDATRALAGRYRCEVSADAPSFHTQVRSAYIHVVGEYVT
ncbi:unnamed protein product [Euphydryas editha]|uniref:Uncharacterized protein n=1 Tax=Euphydryas editha TaxID=104508 RepID=A0AAU9VBV7_EUPED|nr:unnamed protein product [Euphydryas editha]